jgi:hypothetical protein
MRPEAAGLFGKAIYFADRERAARSKCDHHEDSDRDIVLEVEADLDRTLIVEGTELLSFYRCNSVIGRSHSEANWEYPVYDSGRVIV